MGIYNDFSQLKKFKPISVQQPKPAPPPEPVDRALADANSSTDYFSNLLGPSQEKKPTTPKPHRTTIVTPATIQRVKAELIEDAHAAECAALQRELESARTQADTARAEVLRLQSENDALSAERDALAQDLATERAIPRLDPALLDELEEKKQEIARLKALLAEAERTSLSSSVLLEKPAAFSEKFGGELREHVIEALAAATDAAEASGRDRRARILEAVLGANPSTGELDRRRDKVKQIIKNAGMTLNTATLAELEGLGFRHVSSNKHHKLEWAGIRFPFSKTPSDYRACINSANEICNRVF